MDTFVLERVCFRCYNEVVQKYYIPKSIQEYIHSIQDKKMLSNASPFQVCAIQAALFKSIDHKGLFKARIINQKFPQRTCRSDNIWLEGNTFTYNAKTTSDSEQLDTL
jgi:hypothetical protein